VEFDAARGGRRHAPAAAQGRSGARAAALRRCRQPRRRGARGAAHAARFADLTGARPTFLLAPGIANSVDAREALATDRFVKEALDGLSEVTLALVGIGALEPASLLQSSGNIFSETELAALGEQGAVGDICLRFFDEDGERVESDVDRRVIGVTLEQLRDVDRCVGIAGGKRKYDAVRGALRGGWINVLITDSTTAERLLAESA
jgi:DNA-binding transcriptional regulator LsrR (DeoR family)